MKTALLIALALVSVSSFAGAKKGSPEAKAAKACKVEAKAEHKKLSKDELKSCVEGKLSAPATK